MTTSQVTVLAAAIALALFLANLPKARTVKNCFGHGGVHTIAVETAIKYTVTCKDGSTYHRG